MPFHGCLAIALLDDRDIRFPSGFPLISRGMTIRRSKKSEFQGSAKYDQKGCHESLVIPNSC